MHNSVYLHPSVIADIIFDGNRSHAREDIPAKKMEDKGTVSRLFDHAVTFIERFQPPEDEASIKSAQNHLRDIGFNDHQVEIVREIADKVIVQHVEDLLSNLSEDSSQSEKILAFFGEKLREVPHPRYNDRFYLGAQIGGKSLNSDPEMVKSMRHSFVENLETARIATNSLLFTNISFTPPQNPLQTRHMFPYRDLHM